MPEKTLVGILQRHGDTDTNEKNQFRSRLDPPLNEKGFSQAEQASDNIIRDKFEIKRIISSPLLRAMQTADIFSEKLGLPVSQDRGLLCWALGFLSGRDKDDYSDILDYYVDNPHKVIPEGESLDDLEQRTFEFFNEHLKNELTLFVTHTSNIITVENLVNGNREGRPESGESSVDTGGTVGVYVDDSGKYSTEILFGNEKEAQYGS
jgi:broad specificity phosphatase PhoE